MLSSADSSEENGVFSHSKGGNVSASVVYKSHRLVSGSSVCGALARYCHWEAVV